MKTLKVPISISEIQELRVGDTISIEGDIFCGRDVVLPKIVELYKNNNNEDIFNLNGSVIFHTAVSIAGVGPTSSNKLDIESSIIPLSKIGVRIHLGKGQLSEETILGLKDNNSIYAVIPPVTALLQNKIKHIEVIAYKEQGMEAFYKINVKSFNAIVAVANGKSIYK